MSNPSLQELYARKSVRAFEPRPIPDEDRAWILRAAAEAPTAGNQQLYTILDVKSQEIKEHLAVLCDNQPFIARAPLVLVFLADCEKWLDAYRAEGLTARAPGVGDLMLAASDALIAAQNAVTAAWSLGIGSCYIGDVMENCAQMRALLRLPRHVFPAALLVLGYPTPQQMAREKPARCAMEHIVHEDTYRRMDAEELQSMLAPRGVARGYHNWLEAFCNRKYQSAFSHEMTRSVAEYLADFQGDL